MDEIRSLLAGLGTTPDEVAATLRTNGIQGVRNAVRFLNPLVRYLAFRLRSDVLGLDLMKRDTLRLTHGNGRKEETALPEPVRLFLDAFNRGAYPELELPPEQT